MRPRGRRGRSIPGGTGECFPETLLRPRDPDWLGRGGRQGQDPLGAFFGSARRGRAAVETRVAGRGGGMLARRRGARGSARGPEQRPARGARGPDGGAHARRGAGEVCAPLGALQGGRCARRERPETQKESFLFAEDEAPEGARPQQQQQRVLCDPLSTGQGDQTHLQQLQSWGGRPGR